MQEVWSKLAPNSMTIPGHLSRFYLFSMLEHDMDFGFWSSSSHGISMAFAKEMMGFPSDLVSLSTKLPSKRHEKIRVTFFTGNSWLLHTFIDLCGQTKDSKIWNINWFIFLLQIVTSRIYIFSSLDSWLSWHTGPY